MVHHEDHSRIRRDRGKGLLIPFCQAHAVEGFAEEPRKTDCKGEIGEGRKAGHDLARIAFSALKDDILAHARFLGIIGNRLRHFGVIYEPANRIGAPRQFERLNRPRQALVQAFHSHFQAPAQKPAH